MNLKSDINLSRPKKGWSSGSLTGGTREVVLALWWCWCCPCLVLPCSLIPVPSNQGRERPGNKWRAIYFRSVSRPAQPRSGRLGCAAGVGSGASPTPFPPPSSCFFTGDHLSESFGEKNIRFYIQGRLEEGRHETVRNFGHSLPLGYDKPDFFP